MGLDWDIDSDDLKNQKIKSEIARFHSDTMDRKWLAKWTAVIVSTWLAGVLFTVVFNDLLKFCISEPVLITLLGTTTLNVLGLSLIVLRGHFYGGASKNS